MSAALQAMSGAGISRPSITTDLRSAEATPSATYSTICVSASRFHITHVQRICLVLLLPMHLPLPRPPPLLLLLLLAIQPRLVHLLVVALVAASVKSIVPVPSTMACVRVHVRVEIVIRGAGGRQGLLGLHARETVLWAAGASSREALAALV